MSDFPFYLTYWFFLQYTQIDGQTIKLAFFVILLLLDACDDGLTEGGSSVSCWDFLVNKKLEARILYGSSDCCCYVLVVGYSTREADMLDL